MIIEKQFFVGLSIYSFNFINVRSIFRFKIKFLKKYTIKQIRKGIIIHDEHMSRFLYLIYEFYINIYRLFEYIVNNVITMNY